MAIVQETERFFGKNRASKEVPVGRGEMVRVEHRALNLQVVAEAIDPRRLKVSKQTVNPDWVIVIESKVYEGDAINSANISTDTGTWNKIFGIRRWRYIPDPA